MKIIDVKCTNCKETVLELINPVSSGEIISPKDFRGHYPYPSPQVGDKIACPNCGHSLSKALSIVTGLEVLA